VKFYLNPIVAIGQPTETWGHPKWGDWFYYHEVGWTGTASSSDTVFDACLMVDNDADPTVAPHTGWLPVNIVFDDGMAAPPFADYHEKLAIPGATGVGRCVARPATRIRRPVE
jgi:hypothetical protein